MIDGYNRFSAFVHVVLPLSVPGLLTVAVFAFTLASSEFIDAMAFGTDSAHKTIGIDVPSERIRGDVYRWEPPLAGALIASLPVAVLPTFSIDQLVVGPTSVARN